jgi:hypothetical protein
VVTRCVTAISYGVPVVRVPSFNVADRKFEMLDGFAGVAGIDRPDAVAAVLRRRRGPEASAIAVAVAAVDGRCVSGGGSGRSGSGEFPECLR